MNLLVFVQLVIQWHPHSTKHPMHATTKTQTWTLARKMGVMAGTQSKTLTVNPRTQGMMSGRCTTTHVSPLRASSEVFSYRVIFCLISPAAHPSPAAHDAHPPSPALPPSSPVTPVRTAAFQTSESVATQTAMANTTPTSLPAAPLPAAPLPAATVPTTLALATTSESLTPSTEVPPNPGEVTGNQVGSPSVIGTRRQRVRKALDLQLNACTCGVTITDIEISEGKNVMKCHAPGCETVWVSGYFALLAPSPLLTFTLLTSSLKFHQDCMNHEFAPRKWSCESCRAGNGRRRRA